jgi:hypothetical protein
MSEADRLPPEESLDELAPQAATVIEIAARLTALTMKRVFMDDPFDSSWPIVRRSL